MKEYNCSNPSEEIILLPGTIGCQVNSPVSGVVASQECFRGDNLNDIGSHHCSWFSTKTKCKITLLLKTQHTLVIGDGEIMLVLARKFPFCCQIFKVWEGSL